MVVLSSNLHKTLEVVENMSKSTIRRVIAGAALGPYSNGVLANGTLYVSGCIGVDAQGAFVAPDVVGQTHAAMKNMQAVLAKADATFDHVVKCTYVLCLACDAGLFFFLLLFDWLAVFAARALLCILFLLFSYNFSSKSLLLS